MIFDDINRPVAPAESGQRRRRRSSGRVRDGAPRRRRSTFEAASKLSGLPRDRGDRSTVAWLWMLGVLVAAVAGFAFFLQQHKAGLTILPGEAPGVRLLPFIDPVLAPLETGTGGYDSDALDLVSKKLGAERAAANREDQEIFSVASTIASILQEAVNDRGRHLQRLVDLGSPVIGMSEGGAPKNPATTENERRHLELAVDVSWQRNSGAYRNRVDELMARLQRLERGRFGSRLDQR